MKLIEGLIGFKLVEDPRLVLARQIRFPRSKRRRIRRKWARRAANCEFKPDENCYLLPEKKTLIAHPSVIARLKAKLAECGIGQNVDH